MEPQQEPMPERSPAALFQHLIGLSSRLIDGGHGAVAYHVLAAGVEVADEESRVEWLEEIERLANEWQTRLDTQHPDSKITTENAKRRGMPALFTTLARTARAARVGATQKAHEPGAETG